MDDPTPGWRIDTLDARGGLAFASWTNGDELDDSDAPCIFVGAPDFRPEPVANRAIALSASRGSFQIGLFVEGREVFFPDPRAVAEFVRRAYLRSGGGDGTEGGGGENPPLPRPTERLDLPPSAAVEEEPSEGQSLRPKLLSAIRMFREIGSELAPGGARKFVFWPSIAHLPHSQAGFAAWADAANMLGSAAWMLVREMVLRLPEPHDMAATVQWQRDARRLGHTLGRLELWPLLLNNPYWWPLEKMLDTLKRMRPHLEKKDDFFPTLRLVDELFIEGSALLRLNKDSKFYRAMQMGPNRIDPIADLLSFPLPPEFAKIVGKSGAADRSLYHALTAFTASPQTVLAVDKRVIDLMLFASACIVGPASAMPASDLWTSGPDSYLPPVQRAAIEQLHAHAWSWLCEQLPATVFGTAIEDAITQAAELHYESARGTAG